ncbi:MAG: hypothetical protein K0M58_03620, partial [Thiobacillus sp.]|nr:hypothetical protein [Thiobacillus sp.]
MHAGTGNKFQREAELAPSPTGGLAFDRYYNSSMVGETRRVGRGWAYSYARAISNSSSSQSVTATMARPDGKTYVFTQSGSAWRADADIPDRLSELKDANNIRTGWRYTVADDDSVETYSATGKLLSIADRAGSTQALTYDLSAASGGDGDPETLDTVTDDTGRQLRFTYDTSKRIATVTDPAGGVISYGYDAQSHLTSVQYPDGRSKTYHYNEPEHTAGADLPHALTGITDENGDRYATYQYAADGKAISTGHAGGADLHTLAYNPDGSTTVTDPLGTVRTHTFTTILGVVKSTGQSQPGGSGCGPASSATVYDANGNVASRTDFNGHKTCYAHDLARNLETARVEGLASGTACPSTLAIYTPAPNTAQRKILTEWHPGFRLPVTITEAGRETSIVYDARGNVTSRSIRDTALNQTRTWTTSYLYHPTVPGILAQKIENGPRIDVSDLTTTDYYLPDENCSGGHYGCRGQVRQITNALGHVTQITRYSAHGQPEEIVDPNGLVTALVYDARQRLLSRTTGTETTGYEYDAVGQLVKLTQPDGSYLGYTYDAAHGLIQVEDSLGNRIAYTLDAMGNRLAEDVTDPAGQLARTRAQAYDSLGRLARVLDSQNHATHYGYDAIGNLTLATDANNATTRHDYDALNRLIQSLDPMGGATRTQYDALDRVTHVTDPIGVATAYQVDGLGNLVGESSPDSGAAASSYDAAGNLLSRTDATGQTLVYAYDALNRITRIGDASGPLVTYAWDTAQAGKLAGFTDPSGSTAYQYDTNGRLVARTQTVGGLGFSLDYAWNPAGQLAQLTTPGGNRIAYAYAHGKINAITVNGQPLLADIAHAPFGPISGWTWSNGLAHLRAHGLDG